MNHPVLHALAIIAAILIPGAEVLYFAWAVRRRHKAAAEEAARNEDPKDPIEEILEAFRKLYPIESLRARSRRERLEELRRRRLRKFPK